MFRKKRPKEEAQVDSGIDSNAQPNAQRGIDSKAQPNAQPQTQSIEDRLLRVEGIVARQEQLWQGTVDALKELERGFLQAVKRADHIDEGEGKTNDLSRRKAAMTLVGALKRGHLQTELVGLQNQKASPKMQEHDMVNPPESNGLCLPLRGALFDAVKRALDSIRTDAINEAGAELEAIQDDIQAKLDGDTSAMHAELEAQSEALLEELEALRREAGVAEEDLGTEIHGLVGRLDRLSDALCADSQQLGQFIDDEKRRRWGLHAQGVAAEWVVRDVPTWSRALSRGKALESPPFALDAPGVGQISDFRLQFYPNGGPNVSTGDTCSLYLVHPKNMPWVQYELQVGETKRGAFNPLFQGVDDFCCLGPELHKDPAAHEPPSVRLAVRLLPPGSETGQPLKTMPVASAPGLPSLFPTGPRTQPKFEAVSSRPSYRKLRLIQ